MMRLFIAVMYQVETESRTEIETCNLWEMFRWRNYLKTPAFPTLPQVKVLGALLLSSTDAVISLKKLLQREPGNFMYNSGNC